MGDDDFMDIAQVSGHDRLGPVFTASYQSECEACQECILPGEDARADGQGGYIHADDMCERISTGDAQRDRPKNITCPIHFQVYAANGTCGGCE